MKTVFLILSIGLIIGCKHANPKVAIVERQKTITVEKKHIQDSITVLFTSTIGDIGNKSIDSARAMSRIHTLSDRFSRLTSEYDSLEIELKKY
jgi:hypothetical protein